MRSKDIPRVQLRGGFSDRNGIKPENIEMQYKDLDERTRIALINIIDSVFSMIRNRITFNNMQSFLLDILRNVYCMEASSQVNYDENKVIDTIKQTIRCDDYDSVFTVLEYFVSQIYELTFKGFNAGRIFNEVFEKEYVGYRFVNGLITSITDKNEIDEVNEAVQVKHKIVREHISKALMLLSDRENPDYENSIKESISAVEAMCVLILGKGATLGAALKQLEKNGLTIHPSMKSAFEKLYGYTSDASGIRHAGDIGGPSSTFEEAKFMLVSCSAFVNYLISVSATYTKQ